MCLINVNAPGCDHVLNNKCGIYFFTERNHTPWRMTRKTISDKLSITLTQTMIDRIWTRAASKWWGSGSCLAAPNGSRSKPPPRRSQMATPTIVFVYISINRILFVVIISNIDYHIYPPLPGWKYEHLSPKPYWNKSHSLFILWHCRHSQIMVQMSSTFKSFKIIFKGFIISSRDNPRRTCH